MMEIRTACCAVLIAVTSTGSLLAHHSLANFDTTKGVRLRGSIVEIHLINPHSIIFLQATDADGQTRRWAVEGPAVLQLSRRGFNKDSLKPGDIIEVCGYVPKETTVWQLANPDQSGTSMSGRLINAETMTMPDGHEQSWGDYGAHKCFTPGYQDQHSTR